MVDKDQVKYYKNLYEPTKSEGFQKGGKDDSIKTEALMLKRLENIASKLDRLQDHIVTYEKTIDEYNNIQYDFIFHTMYLALMSTNQLIIVDNYIIYEYIKQF